jgi:hypothetical protein
MEEKVCEFCGVSKPVTQFARMWNSPDGYVRGCNACRGPRAESESHRLKRLKAEQLAMPPWARAFCRRIELRERDLQYPHGQIVYALVDPRDNAVRYVGRTYLPAKRLSSHRQNVNETRAKTAWVEELQTLGLEPQMRTLEVVSESEFVLERELRWIYHYLGAGARLTNGGPLRDPRNNNYVVRALKKSGRINLLTEPRDSALLHAFLDWRSVKEAGDAYRQGRAPSRGEHPMKLHDAIAWCMQHCPSELVSELAGCMATASVLV